MEDAQNRTSLEIDCSASELGGALVNLELDVQGARMMKTSHRVRCARIWTTCLTDHPMGCVTLCLMTGPWIAWLD